MCVFVCVIANGWRQMTGLVNVLVCLPPIPSKYSCCSIVVEGKICSLNRIPANPSATLDLNCMGVNVKLMRFGYHVRSFAV